MRQSGLARQLRAGGLKFPTPQSVQEVADKDDPLPLPACEALTGKMLDTGHGVTHFGAEAAPVGTGSRARSRRSIQVAPCAVCCASSGRFDPVASTGSAMQGEARYIRLVTGTGHGSVHGRYDVAADREVAQRLLEAGLQRLAKRRDLFGQIKASKLPRSAEHQAAQLRFRGSARDHRPLSRPVR
jgi:hypothetical protein